MQVGSKVHRVVRGKALGHDKDDEPIGPTCTVTRIYSWKWIKVEQDDSGDVDYVRAADFEEE